MFATFQKSGYRIDFRVRRNLTKVTRCCSLSLTRLHTKDPTMSSCDPAMCLVPPRHHGDFHGKSVPFKVCSGSPSHASFGPFKFRAATLMT